jgi:hypothetical protein
MSADLLGRMRRLAGAKTMHLIAGSAAVVAMLALCVLASGTTATSSGYIAKINNSTNSVDVAPYYSCTAAENADRSLNSIFLWYLNEPSNSTTANDYALLGLNPGTYQGSMTTTTTGVACSRDTLGAYTLNGSTSYASQSALLAATGPTTFSIEIWFKTSVAGGKLIGFGSSKTGNSGSYDRHLYIDSAGKLVFGTYNGVTQVVTSPAAVNDGKWHHAAGTMSPTTGMILYLDGTQVAANSAFATPQSFSGWWRIGEDNLNGWPNAPSNYFFTGQLRYAAAYNSVLTAAQVKSHWAAGQ